MIITSQAQPYAREDWCGQLSGNATAPTIESLVAWGKPMRLDDGFQSSTSSPTPPLSTIRGLLTGVYAAVGPIYA